MIIDNSISMRSIYVIALVFTVCAVPAISETVGKKVGGKQRVADPYSLSEFQSIDDFVRA